MMLPLQSFCAEIKKISKICNTYLETFNSVNKNFQCFGAKKTKMERFQFSRFAVSNNDIFEKSLKSTHKVLAA